MTILNIICVHSFCFMEVLTYFSFVIFITSLKYVLQKNNTIDDNPAGHEGTLRELITLIGFMLVQAMIDGSLRPTISVNSCMSICFKI